MTRPIITHQRIEPLLLPFLRERFPNVVFTTVKAAGTPSRECLIVAEPQQLASPISQYVRLRMSTYATTEAGYDFQAAQTLAGQIEAEILKHGTMSPFIDAEHSSGPIRVADENGIFAYSIILMTVSVI